MERRTLTPEQVEARLKAMTELIEALDNFGVIWTSSIGIPDKTSKIMACKIVIDLVEKTLPIKDSLHKDMLMIIALVLSLVGRLEKFSAGITEQLIKKDEDFL